MLIWYFLILGNEKIYWSESMCGVHFVHIIILPLSSPKLAYSGYLISNYCKVHLTDYNIIFIWRSNFRCNLITISHTFCVKMCLSFCPYAIKWYIIINLKAPDKFVIWVKYLCTAFYRYKYTVFSAKRCRNE